MKKVMTALAVAATALLAFGDVQSGTSFEDLTTGEKAINALVGHTDAGSDSGDFYWLSDAVDQTETALSISNYVSEGISTPIASRPDQFASDSNTKYLHIDVSTPLSRTINPANAEGGPAAQAIGDGIYLDTLVQFTAADQVFGTDALGTGDKIAIEYAETDDGITNFVVRAGVVGSDAANYLVNAPANFDVNAWHRLTVRTIANIDGTLPGFKIYLDEVALTYLTDNADFAQSSGITDDTHTIFPSAVTSGDYKTTISAVAFTGNGSLDDVVFTSTTPNFIKATEAVVATFTADAGVTAITVTVGQTDYNVDMTALTVSLPAGTTTFTVTATIDSANGYSLASLNGGNSNPATVSDYAGDTIAISTTRANFSLFNANGEAISGTYATLAQAMAATGVAKIQLAYDYNVATADIPNGYIDIQQSITIDLNGKTINGGESVSNPLFMVNEGNFVIIDSVGGGNVVYDGPGIVYGSSAYIGAANDDFGPTFDGKLFYDEGEGYVIRGKFDAASNGTSAFLYAEYLGDGDSITSACSAEPVNGYWVVAPAAPAPTWADYLGEAVDGAYEIDNLAELKDFQANVGTLPTSNVTFKLTADITLDAAWPGIGLQNGKDVYTTAEFDEGAFCGTFDGQNHTISGFQMVGVAGNPDNEGKEQSKWVGLDYCGFFNSTYGATIQNLKIQYAGALFAEDTTASTKESGATFVGVAKNSTLQNLTTVAGTVSSSKGFGGIVGYLTSGTTVDSCTNNLNMTSLANNKCGGIAMITQGGSAVTIRNCQNNGTQTTGSSNSEYGAIVGYVGLDVTIENCETTVGRFLKHQGNTVTLQGVNKGDATVLSYHGAATPGLNFATVDGNVATFVADGALAAGNTYKVLGAGTVAATFEFAAAGTIAFDTALATPTFAITAAQGLEVNTSTSGTVTTFTAAAQTTPVQPGGTDGATYNDAQAATNAAEKVVVSVPDAVTNAGVDAATYKAMFEAKVVENNNGTYSVVVDLKPAVEAAIQANVDDATETALEEVLKVAADTAASVTVTTKPGLYYQIVTGNALPLAEPDSKNWTMATGDSTSIQVTKPADNAAFFKVYCTPAK